MRYPNSIYYGLDPYDHKTWGNCPSYQAARWLREERYKMYQRRMRRNFIALLVVFGLLALLLWRCAL